MNFSDAQRYLLFDFCSDVNYIKNAFELEKFIIVSIFEVRDRMLVLDVIFSPDKFRLYYCSDFRYESNGIFVLGVGFFFFRQISTFYLAIFDGIYLHHSKGIVVLSSNLKRYFTCDHFS